MFQSRFFSISSLFHYILVFVLLMPHSVIFGQEDFFELTQVLTDSVNDVDGLNGVNATAISPDGKHLYAVSGGDFSISLFRRNISTGELTFLEIWRDGIGAIEGLDGARHLVISPDGKNVYVAAENDRTVTVFDRDITNGKLTFNEIFNLGTEGAGDVVFLAISPDGMDVFAVINRLDNVAGGFVQFGRNVGTGKLSFDFAYQDEVFTEDIYDPTAISVSPDGKNVYVTSDSDSALTVFKRESANSELSVVETEKHRDGASDGLGDPSFVVVSPNGNQVYLADYRANSIATYARIDPDGEIDFVEIDTNNVNVENMRQPIWIVNNQNGSHVYVLTNPRSSFSEALIAFERDSGDGKLKYVSSLEQVDLEGQFRRALQSPRSIAISPDGAFLYVASTGGNSIGVFKTPETVIGPQKFQINAGLNGSWFYPTTNGQGFLIDVFPESGQLFLAWFTYDTELPADDASANLGSAGQRWMTALGSYSDNQAVLDIYQSEGGLFDMSAPQPTQTEDGTLIIEFADCNSGTVTYDITSIGRKGVIPIQRIANDNVPLCETLSGQ